MSLLSRISAPTREVAAQLDERTQRHAAHIDEIVDEIVVANQRIRQLEAELAALRAGMPVLSASQRETDLQRQVAQLTRNLTAMDDRLAVAEGRDTRVRMRFAR